LLVAWTGEVEPNEWDQPGWRAVVDRHAARDADGVVRCPVVADPAGAVVFPSERAADLAAGELALVAGIWPGRVVTTCPADSGHWHLHDPRLEVRCRSCGAEAWWPCARWVPCPQWVPGSAPDVPQWRVQTCSPHPTRAARPGVAVFPVRPVTLSYLPLAAVQMAAVLASAVPRSRSG
jgi:hypothetical protein